MRKNKKGVALIYVIIASAALLILSGVVAVSAMRNMGLTGGNRLSRYAYDRDKAAIEFAKGVLKQEYDADSTGGSGLKNFSVTAVTDGSGPYNCKYGVYDIDGTKVFAKCEIKEVSDGSYTATITAGYPSSNSDKSKLFKMKYTASCTLEGNGETDSFPFILYGTKYGSNPLTVTNGNTPAIPEETNGQGVSAYPVVFNLPVQSPSGNQTRLLQAPSVFFMGGDGTENHLNGSDSNQIRDSAIYVYSAGTATIKSDFVYIASDRIAFQRNGNPVLKLLPLSGSTGYIYFAQNCSVISSFGDNIDWYSSSTVKTYTAGLYSYTQSGEDLLSYDNNLMQVTDSKTEENILNQYGATYVEDNHNTFMNSDANSSYEQPYNGKADWTRNGTVSGSTGGDLSGYHVFFYANNASKWSDGASVNYTAGEISFMYVNSDSKVTIGADNRGNDQQVTFTADTVSFCGQKEDGQGTDSDSLTLQQGYVNAKFILQSKSKSDVTVTVYHKLVVKKKNGDTYTLQAGVYTVPSGTNLFDNDVTKDTFTFEGEAGGSGAGGGFSGGEYSW